MQCCTTMNSAITRNSLNPLEVFFVSVNSRKLCNVRMGARCAAGAIHFRRYFLKRERRQTGVAIGITDTGVTDHVTPSTFER